MHAWSFHFVVLLWVVFCTSRDQIRSLLTRCLKEHWWKPPFCGLHACQNVFQAEPVDKQPSYDKSSVIFLHLEQGDTWVQRVGSGSTSAFQQNHWEPYHGPPHMDFESLSVLTVAMPSTGHPAARRGPDTATKIPSKRELGTRHRPNIRKGLCKPALSQPTAKLDTVRIVSGTFI